MRRVFTHEWPACRIAFKKGVDFLRNTIEPQVDAGGLVAIEIFIFEFEELDRTTAVGVERLETSAYLVDLLE
jgi:hypothetical protein